MMCTTEGSHVFFAESFGHDDEGNEITTRAGNDAVSEWELTLTVAHDGESDIEDIKFEYDGNEVHFASVEEFERVPVQNTRIPFHNELSTT